MVETRDYVPARGDLVWVTFSPQAGHEQSGRRPAIVLSPMGYNGRVGLALLCPITRQVKGYPFEVRLPVDCPIEGVILADQVKNFDWRARNLEFIGRLPANIVDETLIKVSALLRPQAPGLLADGSPNLASPPGITRRYSTGLTDEQWELIRPLVARERQMGRPTRIDLREVVNALLYLNRTGCPWRLLPTDFPNWNTVRYYFDHWTLDGTFIQMNDALRARARTRKGRDPEPSAGIIDSQSVKTTETGGERGFDGGKKGNGPQTAHSR